MIDKNKLFQVKNRSAGMVVYTISDLGIRREFVPGEVKKIKFSELEALTYQPGGKTLMAEYLQIIEEQATEELEIPREPEYDMSEQQIIELLKNGSLDAFLDALDYAPSGVIDLIKKFAVSLPLSDYNKRQVLKEKTGFDVDKAIANNLADKEAEETANKENITSNNSTSASGRRTTTNYKVVTKTETK